MRGAVQTEAHPAPARIGVGGPVGSGKTALIERLIPALEARGHRAVAMDLPCDDPTAGCARYAEVADAALPPADDLVLVGHSLGGLTIPVLAARRPVRLFDRRSPQAIEQPHSENAITASDKNARFATHRRLNLTSSR